MTPSAPRAIHWREAALCVPALALLLAAGAAGGHALQAAIASGAAFSVGFGAARELRGWRWGAMAGATGGMALATFVGSLAGQHPPVLLLVAAVAAAGCAALALLDEDLWWVALQAAIALLVAGSYAGSFATALGRADAVLTGGAVQMAFVVVIAKLMPGDEPVLSGSNRRAPASAAVWIAHAIRAAVAVVASLSIADACGLSNSYWAPMSVLLILKPGLHDTQSRGVERLAGTVAGCAAATLFASVVHEARWAMALGFVLVAGVAYAVQKARYAWFSAALTASVVLLISLGPTSVLVNAEHRILATLLGGAIALVMARLGPSDVDGAAVDAVGAAKKAAA